MGLVCCPNGVTGIGNVASGIMFIGIAPGADEWRRKQPFTGPSGQLLDATLEAVGLHRDQVFLTNCCCQWFDSPSIEQLNQCRPRLLSEIQACIKSSGSGRLLIVTLGALPCQNIFSLTFGRVQGAILHDIFNSPNVCGLATYHPAAILRSNDKPDQQNDFAADFVRDLEKVKLFIDNKLPPRLTPDDEQYTIISTSTEAQRILDSIEGRDCIIDIETDHDKDTDASDPYGNILCVGLRFNSNNYILEPSALVDLVWPEANYIGANLYGFDTVALRQKYGIKIRTGRDTLIESYVLDERTRRGLHALKPLSREYCSADFWEQEKPHG